MPQATGLSHLCPHSTLHSWAQRKHPASESPSVCRVTGSRLLHPLLWNIVFTLYPFTNTYLYKSLKNILGTQARRSLFPIYKETGPGRIGTSLESYNSQRQSSGPSPTSRRLSSTHFGIFQNYMEATPRSSQLLLPPPPGTSPLPTWTV